MDPYLLLITHLFFADGKVSRVEQSYRTIDEVISPKERASGSNNDWACAYYGEQIVESAADDEAYVVQCVPAVAK